MKLPIYCGEKRDSFLDTNVIIGYIFSLDSSFKPSIEYVFKSNNNYYSLNVQNEVEKVFIRKNSEFDKFFSKLYRKIEHQDDLIFLSRDILHDYIKSFEVIGKLKVNDMQYAFEKIWEQFGFSENQEVFVIKLKLKDFICNFEGTHNLRKNQIIEEMILVPNHTTKDKKILDVIEKENLKKELLHDSDEDILFDANELCKNNPDLNLKFVSNDQKFLEAINILMDYLCIDECINLYEFTPNN